MTNKYSETEIVVTFSRGPHERSSVTIGNPTGGHHVVATAIKQMMHALLFVRPDANPLRSIQAFEAGEWHRERGQDATGL